MKPLMKCDLVAQMETRGNSCNSPKSKMATVILRMESWVRTFSHNFDSRNSFFGMIFVI